MTIALDQSEAGIYVSGHLVADGGTQFNIHLIQKLNGRDDLIPAMFRNRPYAVRHMRVVCVLIDIVESRYTPGRVSYADRLQRRHRN